MKIKFNIYLKLGLGVKAIVAWEQETVKRRKSQKKQAWLWIVIIEPAFIGEGFPFSVFVVFALCVNGIADALAHFLCGEAVCSVSHIRHFLPELSGSSSISIKQIDLRIIDNVC